MVCEKGHKFILSTDFLFGKNTKPVSAGRIEVKRARFHTEKRSCCMFVAALRSTETNFVSLKLEIQPGNTITAVQNYTLRDM